MKTRKTASFTGPAKRKTKCSREGSNLQPSASEAGGSGFQVGTGQELHQPVAPVCTSVCTSEPPNCRQRGADVAAVGGGQTPTEGPSQPGESDFAAALRMIAGLPLSDAERAEAVRRLLRGAGP